MERPAEPLLRDERGEVPSKKQTGDLQENVAVSLVRFRTGVQRRAPPALSGSLNLCRCSSSWIAAVRKRVPGCFIRRALAFEK